MPDDQKSSLDILAELTAEPETDGEEQVVESVEGDSEENSPTDETLTDETVDEAEEEVEETEAPAMILGKYKTHEDLEAAHAELQRRFHEASQRAADHERYIDALARQEAEAAFDTTQPRNYDELVALAYEDPDEAFWFAAEHAPRQVANILAEIRSYEPHKAEELLLQYNNQVMQQQMQQAQMPALQMQAQQQAIGFAQQLHAAISELPDYDAVKHDIKEMLVSRQNLISMDKPQESAQVMRDIYELAISKNRQKIEAANTARRLQHEAAAGTSAGVEAGSSIETEHVKEESPVDQLRSSILAQANATAW